MLLTATQWEARAAAYEEAADHLETAWTDNPAKIRQAKVVSVQLRKKAEECNDRAGAAIQRYW